MFRHCVAALVVCGSLVVAGDAFAAEQCTPKPPFGCRAGRALIFVTATGMRAISEDGTLDVGVTGDYPPDEVSEKFIGNFDFSIVVEGQLCLTGGEYHTIYQEMVYYGCLADVKNPIEFPDDSDPSAYCKKAHWRCDEAPKK